MSPKPSLSEMARRSSRLSLSRLEYSGRSRWLKHVCDVGSCEESGPMRVMVSLSAPRPLIGARALPVLNARSFRLFSSLISCTTDQKFLMTVLSSEKPSS